MKQWFQDAGYQKWRRVIPEEQVTHEVHPDSSSLTREKFQGVADGEAAGIAPILRMLHQFKLKGKHSSDCLE